MRKFRGFKLGKRILRISKWIFARTRRTRNPSPYTRLVSADDAAYSAPPRHRPVIANKIINWGRRLTTGARSICNRPNPGYGSGHEPLFRKPGPVPKGQLAVYVGQNGGDEYQRVLVPVIYINHPLFGELLREAQEEYGFDQEGGITIPCPFAEFQRVKTRIDAGSGGSRRRR